MNTEMLRIGIDLDGVLVRPPLVRNIGLSRRMDVPPLPSEEELAALHARRREASAVRRFLEEVRYFARRPMPGVREGLCALAQRRRVNVVSARSGVVLPLVERWLRAQGVRDYVEGVHLCDVALTPAQFKLYTLRRLGISEHIEDDGATANYLSMNGVRVFLCDWPGNRGMGYPEGVRRVMGMGGVVGLLDGGVDSRNT